MAFVEAVIAKRFLVARGELSRDLRSAVNTARPKEFYEKLVSRRKLNQSLGPILQPRRMRSEVIMGLVQKGKTSAGQMKGADGNP